MHHGAVPKDWTFIRYATVAGWMRVKLWRKPDGTFTTTPENADKEK